MWSLLATVASKFWKQISVGLFAVIAILRYVSLKSQNRKLKSYVKKRIVIDRIQEKQEEHQKENKESKEKVDATKTAEDLNKEWNK